MFIFFFSDEMSAYTICLLSLLQDTLIKYYEMKLNAMKECSNAWEECSNARKECLKMTEECISAQKECLKIQKEYNNFFMKAAISNILHNLSEMEINVLKEKLKVVTNPNVKLMIEDIAIQKLVFERARQDHTECVERAITKAIEISFEEAEKTCEFFRQANPDEFEKALNEMLICKKKISSNE